MKQVDFQPFNKVGSRGRFESDIYPEMTQHPSLRRPTVEMLLKPQRVGRPRMPTEVYDFRGLQKLERLES